MNKLTSIEFPDGSKHQYFYDGAGRRIKSIENGVERRFVYDGWNVIGERRAGSNSFVSYYTRGASLGGGIGRIISVHRTGTSQIYPNGYQTGDYFYHYNHRGDVVSVTNSSGNEVAEYWYDAFGNTVRKAGTFDSPYRFSTKEYDTASGLSYFGFRYYSPSQGIWLSKDPIGYGDGLDLYSFVTNNPVNIVDPWGLTNYSAGLGSTSKDVLKCMLDCLGISSIASAAYSIIPGEIVSHASSKGAIMAGMWEAESYAVGKCLTVPLRSSVYRNLIQKGVSASKFIGKVNVIATFAQVYYCELKCGIEAAQGSH